MTQLAEKIGFRIGYFAGRVAPEWLLRLVYRCPSDCDLSAWRKGYGIQRIKK